MRSNHLLLIKLARGLTRGRGHIGEFVQQLLHCCDSFINGGHFFVAEGDFMAEQQQIGFAFE